MQNVDCRYCGTVLPHRARAMEKVAVASQILADADGDGVPDIVQHLMPSQGGARGGAQVQVNVGGGVAANLPPEVRAQLAARGIDLSGAVAISTTTTSSVTSSTTDSSVSPGQAAAALRALGIGGAPPAAGQGAAVGAKVLVRWSDGNQYPAEVVATQPGQLQVRFTDGRVLWVDPTYVAPA